MRWSLYLFVLLVLVNQQRGYAAEEFVCEDTFRLNHAVPSEMCMETIRLGVLSRDDEKNLKEQSSLKSCETAKKVSAGVCIDATKCLNCQKRCEKIYGVGADKCRLKSCESRNETIENGDDACVQSGSSVTIFSQKKCYAIESNFPIDCTEKAVFEVTLPSEETEEVAAEEEKAEEKKSPTAAVTVEGSSEPEPSTN